MRKPLVSILGLPAIVSLLTLCSCGGPAEEGPIQITKDDILTLEEWPVECWEPLFLKDGDDEPIIGGEIVDVKYDDGIFFLLWFSRTDAKVRITAFDSSGQYLNDIGRQGGAGYEYSMPTCWALDSERNEVLIMDYPATLKHYDYSGNFLRKERLREDFAGLMRRISYISCISDGTLLVSNMLDTEPSDQFVLLHPDSTVTIPFTGNGYVGTYLRGRDHVHNTVSYGDEIWLMRPYDNHIYRLDGLTGDTVCVANLSFIKDVPDKIKYNAYNSDMSGPYEERLLIGCSDLKYHLLIIYYGSAYIFEKSSCRLYKYPDKIFEEEELLPPSMILGYYDNTIVHMVHPEWLGSRADDFEDDTSDNPGRNRLKEFYKKAESCENPVLVLFHLKPQLK